MSCLAWVYMSGVSRTTLPRDTPLQIRPRADPATRSGLSRSVSVRKDVESYESDVIQGCSRPMEDKTDVDTGKSWLL